MIWLLFAGIFLLWFAWKTAYANVWQKGLHIRTEFADDWVYEGEYSALREEIINDKWFPVPALEIRLTMSRELVFSNGAQVNASVTDQSYKRDIFAILGKQKIVRTLPFFCKKRGYYEICQAGLAATDFLSGNCYLTDRPQETSFYVYPALVDTRRIRPVCRAVSGMILTQNRLYPDPFAFSGIREYRPGDPMKQINWKASAKMGELMVNQQDSTTSAEVTVFLDTGDTAILKYSALVEESIRITASLCAWLAEQKMEAELVSNGTDERTKEPLCCRLPSGAARIHEMNRALATLTVQQDPARSIEELLEEKRRQMKAGHSCVIVSKNHTPQLEREIARTKQEGIGVLWVLPVLPGDERLQEGKEPSGVLLWEVL